MIAQVLHDAVVLISFLTGFFMTGSEVALVLRDRKSRMRAGKPRRPPRVQAPSPRVFVLLDAGGNVVLQGEGRDGWSA